MHLTKFLDFWKESFTYFFLKHQFSRRCTSNKLKALFSLVRIPQWTLAFPQRDRIFFISFVDAGNCRKCWLLQWVWINHQTWRPRPFVIWYWPIHFTQLVKFSSKIKISMLPGLILFLRAIGMSSLKTMRSASILNRPFFRPQRSLALAHISGLKWTILASKTIHKFKKSNLPTLKINEMKN